MQRRRAPAQTGRSVPTSSGASSARKSARAGASTARSTTPRSSCSDTIVFAMELGALKPGMTGRAELLVGEEHTAPRVGSGKVHVLATPVMINLIEAAALHAGERPLPPRAQSLRPVLQVRHNPANTRG